MFNRLLSPTVHLWTCDPFDPVRLWMSMCFSPKVTFVCDISLVCMRLALQVSLELRTLVTLVSDSPSCRCCFLFDAAFCYRFFHSNIQLISCRSDKLLMELQWCWKAWDFLDMHHLSVMAKCFPLPWPSRQLEIWDHSRWLNRLNMDCLYNWERARWIVEIGRNTYYRPLARRLMLFALDCSIVLRTSNHSSGPLVPLPKFA